MAADEGAPPPRDASDAERIRCLRLELKRLRSGAEAARLEARAAELELELARFGALPPELASHSNSVSSAEPVADAAGPPVPPAASPEAVSGGQANRRLDPTPAVDDPWASRVEAVRARRANRNGALDSDSIGTPSRSLNPFLAHLLTGPTRPVEKSSEPKTPSEPGAPSGPAKHGPRGTFPDHKQAGRLGQSDGKKPRPDGPQTAVKAPHFEVQRSDDSKPLREGKAASRGAASVPKRSPEKPPAVAIPAVHIDAEADAETVGSRKRPAAWAVSLVAHLVLLVGLAVLTLSVHEPKDQVALSATAVSATESDTMETMEVETTEEITETQTEMEERPLEVDPLGELPMAEVATPSMAEATTPMSSAASVAEAMAEAMSASTELQSNSEAVTEFCGVTGGGNHFVYIVDSSKSMKDGRVESARRELLRSIDLLKPDQRFYVMFYDSNLDRMCVTHPTEPDEYSVLATAGHKQAVRRWAMGVGLERGAPPREALKFALELRPDVIFLLSDGEFPQDIEDLMAEENRVANLFSESKPISILHTIGYHSRAGETRMRRLANANGGQYRYVPPPP